MIEYFKSLVEAIQLAQALGLGLLKWGLTVERRLLKVEVKQGIAP